MNKSLLPIAAAAALLVAGGAQAQGYVGAGLGWTRINADCTGATSCDKTGTGGKVFGGLRFADQFGAELSYFDWGRAKGTQVPVGGGLVSGELKGTGWGLGVAWLAPVASDWQGALRLGIARNHARGSDDVGDSTSENATKPYFGLGLGYRVNRNLSVDLAMDFSRLRLLGENANTQLLTLGLTYGF
jgi:OOP family OmpA-OmpF porin